MQTTWKTRLWPRCSIRRYVLISPLRQGEDKFRSDTFRTDDVDVLTVRLDRFLYDGQSKAGAALVFPAGGVCLVEALPDLVQRFPGDADAVVPDGDIDLVAPVRRLDRDAGIRVAELDGVVDEVVEHLLDLLPVRVHVEMAGSQEKLDGDPPLCTDPLKGGGRVLDDFVDVEDLLVQHQVPAVELVQGQQILGQIGQTLGLKEDDVQVFLLHFRRDRAVRHGLHISLDGCEGRAEIVGYVCHEFLLVILHIPQLCGHVVEGGGQVSHLVLGGDGDLVVQVAGGVLGGCLRDPAQGPVDEELEGQQHQEGEKVDEDHCGVDGAHQHIPEVCQVRDGLVDDQIPLCGKPLYDRGADSDDVLGEAAVIVPLLVGGAPALGGVEAGHLARSGRIAVPAGAEEHSSLLVHQPDGGPHVGGEPAQLHGHLRAGHRLAEVAGQIVVGHGSGLRVEPVRLRGLQAAVGEARGQCGGHKESQETEDDIDDYEFQIQRAVQGQAVFFCFTAPECHYLTSNL